VDVITSQAFANISGKFTTLSFFCPALNVNLSQYITLPQNYLVELQIDKTGYTFKLCGQ